VTDRPAGPIHGHLVCGGRFHDFDHARLRLLTLLAEQPDIRTTVTATYDIDAIEAADLLVSYTCDVRPSETVQHRLRDWVTGGGRWLALHATSASLELTRSGTFTPNVTPHLYETVGNRFVAHPSLGPFEVAVCDPSHPFTAGIEPFTTSDELYLCEYHPPLTPLLATRFTGTLTGYVDNEWTDDEPRLVAYHKPWGDQGGGVLYDTLGHCAGRWDLRPLIDDYGRTERGSWALEVHEELIRRGIRWAARIDDWEEVG
jgi:type 1 glutamine amidotransferase